MKRSFLYLITFLVFISCRESQDVADAEIKKTDSVKDSVPVEDILPKKYEEFTEKPGPVGVFAVPEMLTLCVRDSADQNHMAAAFAKAFKTLIEELKTLKLEPNGAPGSLYFNNDPNNFIFECVYPISKMPAKQPKKSKVVVLEAANMYIYNYYGHYGDLYKAYEEIRKNTEKMKLQQSGPMREFYVTDATKEKNSSKWLTRIMVPVMPKSQ